LKTKLERPGRTDLESFEKSLAQGDVLVADATHMLQLR
jgi:hypothetical protein